MTMLLVVTAIETKIEGPTSPRPSGAALDAPRRPTDRTALTLGAALATLTAALYFLGAGRPLDYDGSITTGLFVKHGSLLDVFRSVYAFNNHPYFSFVEHMVWSAGGRSEVWLRIVPVIAGAAAVGILAAWCARRWGALAGVVAGAALAANPMFASLARNVRGYSLMVLGATIATLIFVDAREHPESLTKARRITYTAALGIAIGTQFYAVVVLAAHVAVLVFDRRFDAAWRRRIAAVVVIGALPYVGMIRELIDTSKGRKGTFLSSFPADATREVLGHDWIAVVLFGALALFAFVAVAWRRPMLPATATIAVALLTIWVVLHPLDLYPRFMVWLVPAVALAAAWSVARRPQLAVVVVIAVAAMVLTEAGSWTAQPIASRQIAHVVDATRADGRIPCATGYNGDVLAAYTKPVKAVFDPTAAAGCDLVFGMPDTSAALLRGVACQFRVHAVLAGTVTILVLSHPYPNRPIPSSCVNWTIKPPSSADHLPGRN